MKGTILEFSVQTNSGVISGEDNQRYTFVGTEWKESEAPKKGDQVDFNTYIEGEAVEIYVTKKQTSFNDMLQKASTELDNLSDQTKPEASFNMIDWFVKCLKNYANFTGRARRSEYWYFVLGQIIIMIVAAIIDSIIFGQPSLLYFVIGLGLFIPSLAVLVRRLHDTGRSGWWALINFIPLVGAIILIVWLATETKPEDNQWGKPAK